MKAYRYIILANDGEAWEICTPEKKRDYSRNVDLRALLESGWVPVRERAFPDTGMLVLLEKG
jgi:hypothetical protein